MERSQSCGARHTAPLKLHRNAEDHSHLQSISLRPHLLRRCVFIFSSSSSLLDRKEILQERMSFLVERRARHVCRAWLGVGDGADSILLFRQVQGMHVGEAPVLVVHVKPLPFLSTQESAQRKILTLHQSCGNG